MSALRGGENEGEMKRATSGRRGRYNGKARKGVGVGTVTTT